MVNSTETVCELIDVTRNHQVCLTGCVCIWLQFLTEDTCPNTLASLLCYALNLFLDNSQDSTSSTSTIVNSVGVICKFVLDRLYGQLSEQTYIVTRRKVLTGFGHIVFLIELTEQLFKDSSHGVVVESGQTFHHLLCAILLCHFLHDRLHREVDIFIGELLQE